MSDNLKLWNAVKTVDTKYVKDATVDGIKITSISSLYPVHMMTKALGPIGGLWRPVIVKEEFVNTQPIVIKGEHVFDGDKIVWEQDHKLLIRIETRASTESNFELAAEQFGHTKYRYVTSKGYIAVDHEYAKKSYSDALKKCLSLFGVCADVFMGDFDDVNYRKEVQAQIAIEKADKNDEEELKQLEEMKACFDDAIEAFELIPNAQALKKVYAQKLRYFSARLNSQKLGPAAKKLSLQLEKAHKERLNQLENKGNGNESV